MNHPTLSKLLRIATAVSIVILALSIGLRVALEFSESLAELYYMNVARHIQGGLAALTSPLPFSLAETLVVLMPVAVLLIIFYLIYYTVKRNKEARGNLFCAVAVVASVACSLYLLTLSALYCRPSLSALSGIKNEEVSAGVLRAALERMSEGIEEARQSEGFVMTESGSLSPYSFDELSDRIDKAMNEYAEKNPWLSPYGARSKQISLSSLMTYTHLSGVYTPYTGEANVNVNYPDFVVVASMAHEKAHQRGIAPENEANVVAMIVLCESGDPYLEYCGYMSVFTEMMAAYMIADTDGYIDFVRTALPMVTVYEMDAYSSFFDKYRASTASKAANAVNNAYLKANGEVHGTRSYGLVVDMSANYFVPEG